MSTHREGCLAVWESLAESGEGRQGQKELSKTLGCAIKMKGACKAGFAVCSVILFFFIWRTTATAYRLNLLEHFENRERYLVTSVC